MTRYDPSTWDTLTDEEKEEHGGQRIATGMSFYDWINADQFIAQVVVDTCQRFLDDGHGHPADMTEYEWNEVLTQMRDGFQIYLDINMDGDDTLDYTKYEEAMQLFAKWHPSLWD